MKTPLKIGTALLIVAFAYSCKQAQNEEAAVALQDNNEASADTVSVAASESETVTKNNKRQFVRTADLQFKVKNVLKSTSVVEDATAKFGGFVTYTNLQSTIESEDKTKVSPDSTLVTTKFSVTNNLTLRVPNTKLDTLLKTIIQEKGFLNHRVVANTDVSLQLLSNTLAQNRSATTEKRMANAIDTKGKKLNQVMEAENQLDAKKESNDAKALENRSLKDQVSFSTVTLELYQDQTINQEMVANEKSTNAYRPNIGLQLWDSVKTGWFVLEKLLSFVVVLWPFALLGAAAYFGYKKYAKQQ